MIPVGQLEDLPATYLPYVVRVLDGANHQGYDFLVFATKASKAISIVEDFLTTNAVSGIIAGTELLAVACVIVEKDEEEECPDESIPDELRDPIRQILKP